MFLRPRRNLSPDLSIASQSTYQRSIFSREVAVQTENVFVGESPNAYGEEMKLDAGEEDGIGSLSAHDLASILKWSKDLSSDINLSSGEFYVKFPRSFDSL
jgi:hypothetical protein